MKLFKEKEIKGFWSPSKEDQIKSIKEVMETVNKLVTDKNLNHYLNNRLTDLKSYQ